MDSNKLLASAQEARDAGMTAVAVKLEQQADLARRLAIAYEHYRFVTAENIVAFQEKLKAKSLRPATEYDQQKLGMARAYYHATLVHDTLQFDAIEQYEGLPPSDVLAAVKEARGKEIFDGMEVAHVAPVASEIKLPDPIVFGRITGCTDRFFIAQWGTDVAISDLLDEHEG